MAIINGKNEHDYPKFPSGKSTNPDDPASLLPFEKEIGQSEYQIEGFQVYNNPYEW